MPEETIDEKLERLKKEAVFNAGSLYASSVHLIETTTRAIEVESDSDRRRQLAASAGFAFSNAYSVAREYPHLDRDNRHLEAYLEFIRVAKR
jgi:hypothetical protein